jgi:hypothetical protein
MGPEQARARVEAHLGRPPADALEAAVVLEAWGGVRARPALELGAALVDTVPPHKPAPAFRKAESTRSASGQEGLALAGALLATATWVAPLAGIFGAVASQQAWTTALPLSLGTQWLVRRRFLGGLEGLAGKRNALICLIAGALVAAGLSFVPDRRIALGCALAIAWVSVPVVVQRGWGFPYAAVLVAVGAGLHLDLPLHAHLAGLFAVPVVAIAAALATRPATPRLLGPWRLALPAGLAGALVGVFIALAGGDPRGVAPDLALLAFMPALLGTLWGAQYLAQIWDLSVERFHRPAGDGLGSAETRRYARHVLAGALGRLVLATGGMAAVVLVTSVGARQQPIGTMAWILGLSSAMGLVGLVVVLLEAFGRQLWAILTAALATAPLLLRTNGLDLGSHGGAVLAAVCIGLLASGWTLLRFLDDPHRSLVVATL